MNLKPLLLLTALLMAAVSAPISAAERVALVIGNNDYLHARKLETAVGDAKAVTTTLRGIGFEVVEKINATRDDFPEVMADFRAKARDAKVVFFYFAGHGIEAETLNRNYLLPVDAMLEKESHLESRAISLDYVLEKVKDLQAPVRLVVLDCCRDNPLQGRSWNDGRSVGPGLGPLDLQRLDAATMVVFSASPGKVARERAKPGDRNSPFAASLLAEFEKKGLSAFGLFANVEEAVDRATDGAQKPKTFFSGSLGPFNAFIFRSGEIPVPPALGGEVKEADYAKAILGEWRQDLVEDNEFIGSLFMTYLAGGRLMISASGGTGTEKMEFHAKGNWTLKNRTLSWEITESDNAEDAPVGEKVEMMILSMTAGELRFRAEEEDYTAKRVEKQPVTPQSPALAAELKPGEFPVAKAVPGRPGFVFSPFNGGILDVRDIPSGRLAADPGYPAGAKRIFRVP